MIRLADGRVVQVSRLLYLVVESLEGGELADVARRVTARFGRPVSVDDVRFLLDRKLAPLGVLADAGPAPPPPAVPPPIPGLRFRGTLIPAPAVRAAAAGLRFLFWPALVAITLAGVVAVDVWLFGHGVGAGLLMAVGNPAVTLVVASLMATSAAFHELGHATACQCGGGRPGRIGVGIYLVWPAFFSDITDSYGMSRAARLRTDLGGVYFNALFALAMAGAYAATGFEPLLVVVVLQHVLVAFQMLPVLRLDGSYLLADLAGVPDLSRWLRPALSRGRGAAAYGLTRRARTIVRTWAGLSAAVAGTALVLAVLHGPALAAAEAATFAGRLDDLRAAAAGRDAGAGAVSLLAFGGNAVPFVGVVVMAGRLGRAAARRGRRRHQRQALVVGARGCRHQAPPGALTAMVGVCAVRGAWALRRGRSTIRKSPHGGVESRDAVTDRLEPK